MAVSPADTIREALAEAGYLDDPEFAHVAAALTELEQQLADLPALRSERWRLAEAADAAEADLDRLQAERGEFA